jgi:hypothetical protein
MDEKSFLHKDREFSLRRKFTVIDLDKKYRIEKAFSKATPVYNEGSKTKPPEIFGNEITGEEMARLLEAVLIAKDGLPVEYGFFDDMEDMLALEIFFTFFLEYPNLLNSSRNFLQNLQKRTDEFLKTSKASQTKSVQADKNPLKGK